MLIRNGIDYIVDSSDKFMTKLKLSGWNLFVMIERFCNRQLIMNSATGSALKNAKFLISKKHTLKWTISNITQSHGWTINLSILACHQSISIKWAVTKSVTRLDIFSSTFLTGEFTRQTREMCNVHDNVTRRLIYASFRKKKIENFQWFTIESQKKKVGPVCALS